ncbi:MAG: sodium:calcium antiporter [Promethearchaeia archaeon]
MLEILVAFIVLIIGIILIAFSSELAVQHSASFAASLGISSLVIGITLVSIGTDISEIFNSVLASSMGHADINIGDSVGSNLTQLTLVFGLLPIICGDFIVKRRSFLMIGSCLILSLILIFTVIEKGYFTRLNGLFMMLSFVFYSMVTYNSTKSDMVTQVDLMLDDTKLNTLRRERIHYLVLATVGFLGVAVSSYFIIESIIFLSNQLNLHEFILSFLLLSLGTSLPELTVCISALRKKHYNIAIGNIIGSCIVDASISIAIGPFFFPQEVSAHLAAPMILYTILASLIVVIVVAKREVMDKKSGILFIILYLLSIPLLFSIQV